MIQELVTLRVTCDGCGCKYDWQVAREDLDGINIKDIKDYISFYQLLVHGSARRDNKPDDKNWQAAGVDLHFCSKKCEGKRSVRFDAGEEFLKGVIEQATKQLSFYKKTEE